MKEKIALIAILANSILAAGKIIVGFFSNSMAILAEGFHSLVDILSSLISYWGVRIARKPSDQKYPYGRYKFEVLAGVIITIILLVTGAGIVYEGVKGFYDIEEININYLAFGIMIFSALVNEIMARVKIYYGKKESSISLLSDGIHSRVDVYASLIVLAGLFLAPYWVYADSFLAVLIGLYIIKESFSLGKEASDSLLDVSAGEEVEEKIKSIAKAKGIDVSFLKTQKKGSIITASIEIKLASNISVQEASDISDKLRNRLTEEIEGLQYVVIQIKSHNVERSFYQPSLGRGFGWQSRGPKGECVCSSCGYKIAHQRGVPCQELKCPNCNINLKRKE